MTWAKEIDDDGKVVKKMTKGIVSAVGHGKIQGHSQGVDRKCSNCGNRGHLARKCHQAKKEDGRGKANFVLAACENSKRQQTKESTTSYVFDVTEGVSNTWAVNSGASRHLVQDPDLLHDAMSCDENDGLLLPDGAVLKVTKRGSVVLHGIANGRKTQITLAEVYHAPKLARNLISMGKLFEEGCSLVTEGDAMFMKLRENPLFDLRTEYGVFVADLTPSTSIMSPKRLNEIVMTAVLDTGLTTDVQKGSLHHFHLRLGHITYDTGERMAKDPDYGIGLTDHVRANCLTCAEAKGTRTKQTKNDSGANAPTDRIRGVICTDLKGPITPKDRRGNRYLVVFIEYKSNYVREFAARRKNAAAKMFEHVLAWFENESNCRIHVLRTDGAGEYKVVSLFCKQTGVRRQVTEAGTPQSNGKAERMNRNVFNMVRSMIFGSGLALTYWSEAGEYAACICNRSTTRANLKHASPIEVLTGRAPILQGIVVFGSPCMVWRDPKKKTLVRHAKRALILGISEETKGYKVLLLKDKVVTTTRHITNIETIDDAANGQIQRAFHDDRGQKPEHVHKKVESEHQVAEQSDAQPKQWLPSGPRRSQRKRKKSKKQAESDEHGECTNVVELETSAKKLQVSDPVLMAFAVLPVEQ
uniref:Copialike retrotransposable element putative n=1 Tax=Albugo laibachii Nc14 TaxID=890382 RepID=F0WBU0_9STRA|nr:copialike retrotransposable element putative [Albugo laibachii Nc14]|eukprot:CCA18617.1 copialike retrotransposable element putative [Albugo laibachii Nc14]